MHYLVHCLDKPRAGGLRKEHLPAHATYLKSKPIDIIMAGPILAEDEAVIGSFLVVDAPSKADVEVFSANDPYTQAEIFESVHINAWKKTIG